MSERNIGSNLELRAGERGKCKPPIPILTAPLDRTDEVDVIVHGGLKATAHKTIFLEVPGRPR